MISETLPGPRPVAGAARGRVHRQAGHRHPAGRRGAAGRPERVRRGPRVRLPARPRPRPTPALDARVQALADAGHPADHDPHARARGPRAGVPAGRARRGASPAGASRSTPSTSPTCSRPRTRPSACCADYEARARAARARRRRRGALRALLLDVDSRPQYVAIMAYCEPSREFDDAAARAARRDPRGDRGPRPRSATARASCTRPASSTRAARKTGRFLQLRPRRPRGRRDPGRAVHLHHAQERAGDRRPADAARARPARRAGAPDRRRPRGRPARPHRRRSQEEATER